MIGAIRGRGFVVGTAEFGTRLKCGSDRSPTLLLDIVIIVQQGLAELSLRGKTSRWGAACFQALAFERWGAACFQALAFERAIVRQGIAVVEVS